MELDFAFLADSAEMTPQGLSVVGAGVDVVIAPAVPTSHSQLVLVARVIGTADEARRDHTLRITVEGPGGLDLDIGARDLPFHALGPQYFSVAGGLSRYGMGAIQPFRGLPLPAYGVYAITLELDDQPQPVKVLELEVVPPPVS